ncbi:alpha-2-HS-glycoprotein-like isoform X2 [Myxocyprinus asiaticus]|uniref:alpha-2-HS-glycoprotein-like isoform X2 n=1 Tax=Myxocyprinus asiaticus TaxID=70543 RepID=UPI00222283BD|nr:alpha-2-HS-glycoprotein-like isoform X2 [Myxocyprinus asiaticus]
MKLWATVAALGLLVIGAWAQGVMPTVSLLPCDSPEAEAAALVAQDFLNAQHTHGYKYALNRIEEIKIISKASEVDTYLLELDLLETTCHVLDPTPVSQCPVRQKQFTAVEADCDFALSNTTQGLSVVAFKCKSEIESEEDICLGCRHLIPFNDTDGIQLIETSLDDFNKKHTLNTKFVLFEIGRMAYQVVSGGNKYFAEYGIIGTNCTSHDDDICIPQNHTVAIHGFCQAEGSAKLNKVDCSIFNPAQVVDPATNAKGPVQQLLHAHTSGPQHNPTIHGLKHHKLTHLHDPSASGLLSAESSESAELVVPKKAPFVKREVAEPEGPAANATADAAVVAEKTPIPFEPILLVPICPGQKKHF